MGSFVTAKKGDDVISIAAAAGFANWKTVYDAPENGDLRKQRPDPHTLMEGDKVFVPDLTPLTVTLKAGHTYLIKTKQLWATVDLIMNDPSGNPYAGKKWTLKVAGKDYSGTTDDKGKITQKVPPEATQGELTVFLDDKGEQKLEWTVD